MIKTCFSCVRGLKVLKRSTADYYEEKENNNEDNKQ